MEKEIVLVAPRVSPTTGKPIQFIRVTEQEFNKHGMVVGQRVGFLQIDPPRAKEALAAAQSGELSLEFGNRNRQTQLFEILVIETASGQAGTDANQTEVLAGQAK